MEPTITGTVAIDFYGSTRLHVSGEEAGTSYPHDCVMDAVVTLALRKAGLSPKSGDRLRVTVEVLPPQ